MLSPPGKDMQKDLLQQALIYHKLGLSIIPLKGKRPVLDWKEFQDRKASEEEIKTWFSDESNITGIGIVTGKISDLIVLDTENGANLENLELPETVTARSGGGGRHFYFKYPAKYVKSKRIRPLIDIKGDGGCITAPPSIHKSGNKYEWEVSFDDAEVAEAPQWIFKELERVCKAKKWRSKIKGVKAGNRNETATSIIGKTLNGFPVEEWEEFAWPLVQGWNSNNNPPLDLAELRGIFDSIASREKDEQEKETENETRKKADRLVTLVLESDATLFHDQFQEPYIALYGNGKEILKLNSKSFRRWLANKAWTEMETACGGEVLKTATQILEGKACFDSPENELQVRIARFNETICYDLGDGRVINITPQDWKIIDNPPIIFKRLAHQKIQTEPKQGGNTNELFDFINIRGGNNDLLLILVSIIAGFLPGFPHPILLFHGAQGSAKTTLARILKEIVDPSILKTLTMPDTIKEFIQLVSHHWMIPLDNLSDLNDGFSDALCRSCTGDGFSKRELYSDDEDIIYEFQRFICINGINLVAEKPDLLDRCLIIGLERIAHFEEEKAFWQRFRERKPFILGAILDVLVLALREIDNVPNLGNARMADFMKWGYAITKALGYEPEKFVAAYENNVAKQNEEALEASPVAVAILDMMDRQNRWEGTPSELLSKFNERAGLLKINTKATSWPKDAHWLWRRIQEARTNLETRSIKAERSRDERRRYIIIEKVLKNDVSAVSAVSKEASKKVSLFGDG